MFDRARQDVYVIDLDDGRAHEGDRGRLVLPRRQPGGPVPAVVQGRSVLDVRACAQAETTNISGAAEDDLDRCRLRHARPRAAAAAGTGGWLKDDAAVLLYDQHDIWRVSPDGSGGDAPHQRRRGRNASTGVMRLDSSERAIRRPAVPSTSALCGRWTKKDGYARADRGAGRSARGPPWSGCCGLTRNIGNLLEGEARRTSLRTRSRGSTIRPDVFVGGAGLADAVQVTRTNPFQGDFAWGRSSLVDYRNARGERLQGALLLPRRVRARAAVPDDRVRLRAPVAGRPQLRRSRRSGRRTTPRCSPRTGTSS